jgi:lipoic acid synthetase
MIMGDICTRGCRFCAVKTAPQGASIDKDEGNRIASAAAQLGLKYVVLTSVDRDDLDDRGAAQFASANRALRDGIPQVLIENLTPDYTARELAPLYASPPDVAAHNVETVPRLQSIRDSRASWAQSIATLRAFKQGGIRRTKSSLMLGLGETRDEVLRAMDALREADTDLLVLGQYLQPTPRQLPVAEYIRPDQFAAYADDARSLGFTGVVSSPLARTSYHAAETMN